MIMLMSAALVAAQPATPANPPMDSHAQHQMQGMAGHDRMMEDCHKCCEEMMAKMHEGHHSKHGGHRSQ